ncbi:MAG: aquaporin [Clostridiales bacterium]|nr:aquaporin [Clostridiales bacterium]
MKKYISEFIGTMVLVILGCGTAMLVGCNVARGGYILTALAFGLAIVATAYCIGNVSGCHVNPAVSLAVLINGGMSVGDFIGYVIAQCLGALGGSAILAAIFGLGNIVDMTDSFGANGLSGVNGSAAAGLLVEIVLTFIFVMCILGVTSKKANHGSFGGLVIGLTLTAVHILGIGLTGTSVNPARSLGPAIVSAISGNTEPLGSLWVFIVAPLVGGALAAIVYKFISGEKKAKETAPAQSTAEETAPAENTAE